MNKEKEVINVLKDYVKAGLIDYDVERVLSHISENIIGIGMGEQGFVTSKEDVRNIITNTMKQAEDVVYDLEYKIIKIRFPTENIATLCAEIIVKRKLQASLSRSGLMQSLTLKLENGKWLITALHASPSILSEEYIDAYPLKFAENTLAKLKSELQSETFELINKSIPGGIVGSFANQDYHMYFVNDGILKFLGYNREEFEKITSGLATNFIHPDDKEHIKAAIEKSLLHGNEFELKHRVLKRDKTEAWMIHRGKRSKDEKGNDVLISVFVDITEMVKLQNELEVQKKELTISEERFRIALEKTSNIIFDYDLISGDIIHSSTPKKSLDFVTNVSEAQNSLIIGGKIMNESLPEFEKAFHDIQKGAKQANCVVKVRLISGKEIWNKISMTSVADSEGNNVRAIGLIEDITEKKEMELAYTREEQYRQAILSDAMATYIINFSKDCFESYQVESDFCAKIKQDQKYDDFVLESSKYLISECDRKEFVNKFSKINVMKAFRKKEKELKLEYNIVGQNGVDLWVQTTLRLVIDVTNNEKKGFFYVEDIDKKKRKELLLTHKSERDSMTGLYNKIVTEMKIKELLKASNKNCVSVFMMIDVDNFKNINDTYGHPFGDKVLINAAKELYNMFSSNSVVGRFGGDEFCVFFCDNVSIEQVKEKAENICSSFRKLFVPKENYKAPSCSIGISICSGIKKSFEQIYKEADSALYKMKENGRNGYHIF